MDKTLLHRLVLLGSLCFVCAATTSQAQLGGFNFAALEGLPAAQEEAETALGSDAYPILIGTPGEFEFQGLPIEFDLKSGNSTIWGYVFYSPSSEEFASYVVVRILTYQVFELGTLPFPVPNELINELKTNGQYANSTQMIKRLASDTAYTKYRSDLPDAKPGFVTFSGLVESDSLELPNGFPVGQGTWTLSFQGGGDSTMTCVVASETGEAFCRRIYGLPTLSTPGSSSTDQAAHLSVSPNPANGYATIQVTGINRAQLTSSRLLLYNAAGEQVMDLSRSFADNDFRSATFPVHTLPPGPYHCRLAGANTEEHVGLIIIE